MNDLEYAVKNIKNILGNDVFNHLVSGLPGAKHEVLCYDVKLFLDISSAIDSWQERNDGLIDPWVVSYFDGNENKWTQFTKRLTRESAYREWFNLTSGGTKMCENTDHSFYHLGKYGEKLNDRFSIEEPEDESFSVSYLLSKSFG